MIVIVWAEDHKEDLMLRARFIIGGIVAIGLMSVSAIAQEAAGGPKLAVPGKIVDLGNVSKGDMVEAVFKLVNEGNEPLLVKSVRPTCGCTVADYDPEILPGAEGQVTAKLDTTDFSGPVSKSILIMTNDSVNPTVTVVIKANVQPHIDVLPRPLIRFNAVTKEDMEETVIIVASDPEREFKITEVESSVSYLLASYRSLDEGERLAGHSASQYEISLKLADDVQVGPVSGRLIIHTDHPDAPSVPIKVYGVVRALLHVTPPQIQFGSVEAKDRPGRNVIVVSNRTGGVKTQVTGVSVDDPAFSAEVRSIKEGSRYQVTVTIDPEAEPGVYSAQLTVKTNDPEYPELEVPVRAKIR
jgi:hypothetical protein